MARNSGNGAAEWFGIQAAQKCGDCSAAVIYRLAMLQLVRVRRDAEGRLLYSRDDLMRARAGDVELHPVAAAG